ncbi:hypothetical protein EVAR_55938_1 [Eumeta japonica]|uniref:Uncharacterized protein n=1 Tax=Eumeta variegata TaxID=151549 RepID=A0A4C1YXZ1_EUMVA|nr:hypothetical protein EVAR_55938_1 [Eumeta japonica]
MCYAPLRGGNALRLTFILGTMRACGRARTIAEDDLEEGYLCASCGDTNMCCRLTTSSEAMLLYHYDRQTRRPTTPLTAGAWCLSPPLFRSTHRRCDRRLLVEMGRKF